jgi:hypothetical protein
MRRAILRSTGTNGRADSIGAGAGDGEAGALEIPRKREGVGAWIRFALAMDSRKHERFFSSPSRLQLLLFCATSHDSEDRDACEKPREYEDQEMWIEISFNERVKPEGYVAY